MNSAEGDLMRNFLALTIVLLLFSPKLLIAKESLSLDDYQYQRALYFSLTGDYLSSAEISSRLLNVSATNKDRLLLLLRFSEIEMQISRDYPDFTSNQLTEDVPSQIKIMNALYQMRRYQELLSFSESVRNSTSYYFEGLSLFRLNRLEEAKAALTRIQTEDRFYPYAIITIAQIEVMNNNLQGAETHLRNLSFHSSMKEKFLNERVHILLGQILFERGYFHDSIKELSQISPDSPSYGQAAVCRAWSMIRISDYKGAIPILKLMKLYSPYDKVEREALTLLGYCFLKLGWVDEAREHFRQLLDTVNITKKRLEEMMADRSIRERYISILIDDPSSLNGEEEYYLSLLKGDSVTYDVKREFETLNMLKSALLNKEREMISKESFLENRISNGEEKLKTVEDGIVKLKKSLFNLIGKDRHKFNDKRFDIKDITYFASNICAFWEGKLGQKVDEETKNLVELIMRDWIERGSPECRNPLFICHILSFININRTKIDEDTEEIREIVGVMQRISSDLTSIKKREKIRYELEFPLLRDRISKDINNDRERIHRLERIRGKLEQNLKEIEKGTTEGLARLDMLIKERFLKESYELEDYKKGVILWLNAANGAILKKVVQ